MKPSHTAPLPLQDVIVLAVEQYGAGPWATLQLADLGARVVKIEDPRHGGDVARYVPPYASGEDSLFFEAFNRGKESVSLDLRNEHGRAVFADLTRAADGVFCNLRGDLPERMGLTYSSLGAINPRIVCCSLSGYGRTGPDRAVGAYDYVIQARAGWMSLTGDPSGPPARAGLSLVDFSGGYVAAIALISGICSARATGTGCDCDIALFDTALSLLNYVGTWTASAKFVPIREPDSAHPSIVPFQQFRTSDGWLVVACPKQKFWRLLCEALELPELVADPRTEDFAARHEHREWVLAELRRRFAQSTTAELLELLRAAGVPSARINDVAGALADEQALSRGAVAEYDHPTLGPVRTPASPLRVGNGPRAARPAPRRGEHTSSVLAELCGYDEGRIAALARAGALGTAEEPEGSR
jgi:crotonobetainyl-CoA:carnitine CoA-transferase CaiB-like acyl-CoA transferase